MNTTQISVPGWVWLTLGILFLFIFFGALALALVLMTKTPDERASDADHIEPEDLQDAPQCSLPNAQCSMLNDSSDQSHALAAYLANLNKPRRFEPLPDASRGF